MLRFFCCDDRRRADVRSSATLNGIDYLEVLDEEAPTPADRQRILRIHFLKKPDGILSTTLSAAQPDNVKIAGGTRVRNIRADNTTFANDILEVHVTAAGDYSTYTLSLVETTGGPMNGLDPLLSEVDFSFKVECDTDLDCRSDRPCPPDVFEQPEIDYLSKDYNSFRQLMLDRLSVIAPQWTERNPADFGIALVEVLAYVGDYLSYQQDAVATEAYLFTARKRRSARRHARMLDYRMHDGSNARVWVQVQVNVDNVLLPRATQLFSRIGSADPRIAPDGPILTPYSDALAFHPIVFETMEKCTLYNTIERLPFYTWGEQNCCLPRSATSASLAFKLEQDDPRLKPGTVLVFMEEVGPRTGEAADADPRHRHAVRLTNVVSTRDSLRNQDVTEIEWADEDALPFPLCISSIADEAHGRKYLADVSVALGNIVLADHGRTISEILPSIPEADPAPGAVPAGAGDPCNPADPIPTPPRYRPRLTSGPLTMVGTAARTQIINGRKRHVSFDPTAPASTAFEWDVDRTLPAISLSVSDTVVPSVFLPDPKKPELFDLSPIDQFGRWFPQRDLLASDQFAMEFVAEVEEDGFATLRFGDDEYGQRPTPGTKLTAVYRVGNGVQGNVGAGALAHIVSSDGRIDGVYSPLPARGGREPETIEKVRQNAPSAFRIQQRAVTPEDYAEVAARHPQVQRAAATLRWTGSWYTVFLNVDRVGGRDVDPGFAARLSLHMERYRMAGHDLEIAGPHFVPLDIRMFVCVLPDYYASDVKAALLEAFSNQAFPDGRRGFFHPDAFTFGQPVYLSRMYAVAQAVQGVRFVEVTRFQRLGVDSAAGIDDGVLDMGPLEIARLDNDPSFAERGLLVLDMGGGR
jgi:hypothetical protein